MPQKDLSKLSIPELKAYLETLDKKARLAIEREYDKLIKDISGSSLVRHQMDSDLLPTLGQLTQIDAFINKRLTQFFNQIYLITSTQSIEAWKTGEILQGKVAKRAMPQKLYTALQKTAIFEHRQQTMQRFQMNKATFTQSANVWREGTSEQIRLAIELNIAEGKGADVLARQLRQYLREPDRVYRRFKIYQRDIKGKPIIGKDGKPIQRIELRRQYTNSAGKKVWRVESEPYSPGRGVYRSSLKNALRMARNEIVKSYRTSQIETMRANPAIRGLKIQVSNNHTFLNAEGKAIPYEWEMDEICLHAQGSYPLDWIWDGWHVNCYDDQSEVLTNRGWQLFKNVKVEDKILSLNPETRNMEWTGIKLSFCRQHKGKMVRFFNKSLDILVTPEHEMVYIGKTNGKISRCTADEFSKGRGTIYRTGGWDAPNRETININGKELNFELFCEFMGYWLADGSTIRNHQIVIAQMDGDPNKAKIQSCIEAMGFRVQTNKEKINFYCTELCRYLKQFKVSFEKYVPIEIKEASSDQIQRFLDAFISCDGSIAPGRSFVGSRGTLCVPKYDRRTYFTTSPQMAGDIGEMLLKTGKRPSYYVDKVAGKEHQFRNGTYTINHDLIRIAECTSSMATVFDKEYVDYDGMVYDLTLEKNSIMYIRRNNKCFWGSNCRCLVLSLFMPEKIMQNMARDIAEKGKYEADTSQYMITELPKKFIEWIGRNQKLAQSSKWYENNSKYHEQMGI